MHLYDRLLLTFLICLLTACAPEHELISVEEARSLEEGNKVRVSGIITYAHEGSVVSYLQDATAGIALYGDQTSDLLPGDSVVVTGTIGSWSLQTQITPVEKAEVIAKNRTLPAPDTLRPADLQNPARWESQRVTLPQTIFTEKGFFKGNTNYTAQSGNKPIIIRIFNGNPLQFSPIPEDTLYLTGVMGRFWQQFQLLPGSSIELAYKNGPGFVSQPKQIELETHMIGLKVHSRQKAEVVVEYGKTPLLEKGRVYGKSSAARHEIKIDGLRPGKFYYMRTLLPGPEGDTSRSVLQRYSTASASNGKIQVFFNYPPEPGNNTFIGKSMPDTLARYIGLAQETLDLALYNFNNDGLSVNLSQALNEASERGVRVRVVACGSTAGVGLRELNSEIPVLKSPEGRQFGIMHHKFILFDARHTNPDVPLVWTGSMNLTRNQVNRDPNHALLIRDQALSKAYLEEFNGMWGGNQATPDTSKSVFGTKKSKLVPNNFRINDLDAILYFSPYEPVTGKLIAFIQEAEKNLFVATMLITRHDVANALIAAHNRGVEVNVLISTNPASNDIAPLLEEELGDRFTFFEGPGIMHHKYVIRDQGTAETSIWTGSHNWGYSAEKRNDENVLILRGQIAEKFAPGCPGLLCP